MAWERFELLLSPRLLVSRRKTIIRWRKGSSPARAELVEPIEVGVDWKAAVSMLEKSLVREARRGMRVGITLSDLWVRFHMIQLSSTRLSEREMLSLARTHFARQYPEIGPDNLTIRLALSGSRLMAAGIESDLLRAIEGVTERTGSKLVRIEPLFSHVFDRFEKILASATGWILLDEPGMLTLACVEKGCLTSLHFHRCEADQNQSALQLLERQSALLGRQLTEVRVFSVAPRQIHLPAPWRIVWQQNLFEFEGRAFPTVAPEPLPRRS